MSIEVIENRIRSLHERFIAADEKTGNPEVDNTPTGEMDTPEDEYDEVQDLMLIAQNGAMSASIAIDQMLRRGHRDKLATLFGAESEALLKDTLECLKGIVEMMGVNLGIEPEEEVTPETPVDEPISEPVKGPEEKPEA